MSAATSLQPALDAEVHEFMKVWATSMGEVVSQIAGSTLAVESVLAAPPETPAADEHDLQMTAVAAGSLRGEMCWRVPRTVVLSLGQLFLQETPDPAAEAKPDHRDAVEELLRQVTGQAVAALSARWGDAQLRVQSGAAPTWSAGSRGWLVSASGTSCRLLLEWQLSAALVAALRTVPEAQPASPPAKPAAPEPNKLDLLMDVELDLTLRFGQRNMTLREIMELDAGSIVELDRQVQEPADLLLEGRVIARGEVVVVDGNYGLRVLEIVSPPDKK